MAQVNEEKSAEEKKIVMDVVGACSKMYQKGLLVQAPVYKESYNVVAVLKSFEPYIRSNKNQCLLLTDARSLIFLQQTRNFIYN